MIKIIKIETEGDPVLITTIHYHVFEDDEKLYSKLDLDEPVEYADQTESEIITLLESEIPNKLDKMQKKVLEKSQAVEKIPKFRRELIENEEKRKKITQKRKKND